MPASNLQNRDPSSVRELLESSGIRFAVADYRPSEVIFLQGDPGDSVMHLERGRVRLVVTERNGKEAICGLLEDGAFLGEEALARQGDRPHSAITMTAATVLVIAKAQIPRLLHSQPALTDRLIAHLLARQTRLETGLADQLLNPAEQRLAHTLLGLASHDAQHPSRDVLPGLSQEIIAEMVGTTRSRVNVFMGKFKKAGFIEEDDGVLVVHRARLRRADAESAIAS